MLIHRCSISEVTAEFVQIKFWKLFGLFATCKSKWEFCDSKLISSLLDVLTDQSFPVGSKELMPQELQK